jgi:hypothetical protein
MNRKTARTEQRIDQQAARLFSIEKHDKNSAQERSAYLAATLRTLCREDAPSRYIRRAAQHLPR